MKQKIRTGQRVKLINYDSNVLKGAVGIICDNDSETHYPCVKWMDRLMIAPEIRLRGNSPQSRTISIGKDYLELLEDKRRYPVNGDVVLIDDVDEYLAGTPAVIKCYIGENARECDGLSVDFYDIIIGDDIELTVDETQIGTVEDFKFAADPQFDILEDKPICILDTVKFIGDGSEFEPNEICSVCEVYDNGNHITVSSTDSDEDETVSVNDVELIEAKYPLAVGDKVVVTRSTGNVPQGQIGVIKSIDLWNALPYQVVFDDMPRFNDWWVSAHSIDLVDKKLFVDKVESETIKHEEDGFSKEITFFY